MVTENFTLGKTLAHHSCLFLFSERVVRTVYSIVAAEVVVGLTSVRLKLQGSAEIILCGALLARLGMLLYRNLIDKMCEQSSQGVALKC